MKGARITITYCRPCQFLPRATWLAQELLNTFLDHVSELALVPGRGGVLDIAVDGHVVFSKDAEGRYPQLRELKEAIAARLEDGAWTPKHQPGSAAHN